MSTPPAASLERLAQKEEGHEFCSPWAQDTLNPSSLSLNWERELGMGVGVELTLQLLTNSAVCGMILLTR